LLQEYLEPQPIVIGGTAAVDEANHHRDQVKGVLSEEGSEDEPRKSTHGGPNGKRNWSVLDHVVRPPQPSRSGSPACSLPQQAVHANVSGTVPTELTGAPARRP